MGYIGFCHSGERNAWRVERNEGEAGLCVEYILQRLKWNYCKIYSTHNIYYVYCVFVGGRGRGTTMALLGLTFCEPPNE